MSVANLLIKREMDAYQNDLLLKTKLFKFIAKKFPELEDSSFVIVNDRRFVLAFDYTNGKNIILKDKNTDIDCFSIVLQLSELE
jgi:hypothetical protein